LIKAIRQKGLARLYTSGDRKGVPSELVPKCERILARLDIANNGSMLNLPGLQLHPLKGDLKGFWSVSVSGNWRIIFRFEAGDATDVDLIDYH
jgi:proteic killer suppression protein